MLDVNRPPSEVRNFVHGRIIGAVGGFLTGGVTGALGGAIRGGRKSAPTGPRLVDAVGRPTAAGLAAGIQPPRTSAFTIPGLPSGCVWPTRTDPRTGKCSLFVGDQPGPEPGGVGGGEAVMGRYGAALVPDVDMRRTFDCLPGMVLGKDELCYNRRDIKNSERKWPRGTRPLGTPGEMAALRKAASFGRRMETTIKRMQKIGVVKKPSHRRPAPRSRQIGSGSDGVRVVNVE